MQKQSLAKARFIDLYQRSPWRSNIKETTNQHDWPLLEQLHQQQKFGDLEYFLVHYLLRNFTEISENVALFLLHLALAAKHGHLCVQIKEKSFLFADRIAPSVVEIWHNEENEPFQTEEVELLTRQILKGAKEIPEGLSSHLNVDERAYPVTPLCQNGSHFYLQRHWIYETVFFNCFQSHLSQAPLIQIDNHRLQITLAALLKEKNLLEEQALAIKESCLKIVTLIIGGPGTGKTYTAGHLIKVFWEQLSLTQQASCQIILAAPTGKAAMNLQRSLRAVTDDLVNFPVLQAKTLHSLLKIKNYSLEEAPIRLTADLIVIDESSMIDIKMMACLFQSIKPGARLILLGDQHQLPSVEAGSVFSDLIEGQKQFPQEAMACIQLSTCLRAELASLIDFAQLIHEGKANEVLIYLNEDCYPGVKRLRLPVDKPAAQRALVDYALSFFPSVIQPDILPEQLLEMFQLVCLLSPVRKGLFGAETLNHLIWKKISTRSAHLSGYIAIPIIITANDHRQELFNGETGVLVRKLPLQALDPFDYALFPSLQANIPVRRQSALLLPKHEYAYCLSVHKSQGAEFKRVILSLPEGSEVFGREVFYTAVTRARNQIELYGSDQVILKTVQQKGSRLSGIQDRFCATIFAK